MNSLKVRWNICRALGVFLILAPTVFGEDATVSTAVLLDVNTLYQEHAIDLKLAGSETFVEFRYRLLSPAVSAAGAKYPLVIFLHGAGERGQDNRKQLKYLPTWLAEPAAREKYPCFVLAPQRFQLLQPMRRRSARIFIRYLVRLRPVESNRRMA